MIFYFIMVPEHKHYDIRSLGVPKISYKRVPLSERVKVLKLIKKGENIYAAIVNIYGKSKSSVKVMKEKRNS